MGSTDPFWVFQTKYKHDPAQFVLDCIKFDDGGATPYQLEILRALPKEKRVAIRAPHGSGKTAIAAWVVLWAVLTADDCKVPTTASAWRQLTKFLWPEIRKWALRLKWDVIGRVPFSRNDELLLQALKRGDTCEAFAVASNDANLIEGAHAQRIVFVYDEAKAIPDETWDAAEGAFAGAGEDTDREAYALAISTPGDPSGRFYQIHSRKPGYEDWWVRHVTLEESIAAGRVSRDWAEKRKHQWGEKSAVYFNRCLGQFSEEGGDSLIPLSDVEAANRRWHEWREAGGELGVMTTVGVDVAWTGEDRSSMAPRHGHIIPEIRFYAGESPMEIAGRVKGLIDARGGRAIVDVIGIGAGVYSRLQEQGVPSEPFVASAKTAMRDISGEMGYADTRSAAWCSFAERLKPDSGENIILPPDDQLIGDLTAPHKPKSLSGARFKLESKEVIAKRIKRSTDAGDAVVQAFWVDDDGFTVSGAWE